MVSKNTQDQKKKDLKNQYQVADVKKFDVMPTHTTAYPMQRVITGEQWSEKIYNKRKVKSSPSSPIEKVSTQKRSMKLRRRSNLKSHLKRPLEENFMKRMILEGTQHQIYK